MRGAWGSRLSRAGLGFVLAVVATAPVALTAGPASAHARITGSAPADGEVVDVAPDEVVLHLDAKPATVEGDPLQVFGPDGERIDAGDARVDAGGTQLSVRLAAGKARPVGDYHVLYRLISADSHMIAGHLSFRSARSAEPAVVHLTGVQTVEPPSRWHQAASADKRLGISLLAASGLLAAGAINGRRRRGRPV